MGANKSYLGDLYYKTNCNKQIMLKAGTKFYVVTSYTQPNIPNFMAPTHSIRDIGVVCKWKLNEDPNRQLYVFELELIDDILVVELRTPEDIVKLHTCTGIEYKFDHELWDNYHTLYSLNNIPEYEGWIEYPTAELGHPLGVEIAFKDKQVVKFTGQYWTLEDILIQNANDFNCIDLELVEDLKKGNPNAIKFAKEMILDGARLLNNEHFHMGS